MKSHNIKPLCIKLGITQIQLAKLCNVSPDTVNRWQARGATGAASVLLGLLGGDSVTIAQATDGGKFMAGIAAIIADKQGDI